MNSSKFYGKCLRIAYVSVVVTVIGAGVYAVLSDNGFIPQPKDLKSDSKIEKAVSRVKDVFSKI